MAAQVIEIDEVRQGFTEFKSTEDPDVEVYRIVNASLETIGIVSSQEKVTQFRLDHQDWRLVYKHYLDDYGQGIEWERHPNFWV